MDSSAWVGLTILAAVILLLGYVRKASMAHSKRLSKLFNKLSRENKLHINETISWDNGILGIDSTKGILITTQENYHVIDSSVLRLDEISACKLIHERLPTITKISLVCSLKKQDQKSLCICFYNSSTDILTNMAEMKEKAHNAEELILKYIATKVKG